MRNAFLLSLAVSYTLVMTINATAATAKETGSNTTYLPNAAWYIQKNAPQETEQSEKSTPTTLQEKITAIQGDLALATDELKSSLLALAAKPDALTNDAYKTCTKAKAKMESIRKKSEIYSSRLNASIDAIDKTSISTDDKAELKAAMTKLSKTCNEISAAAQAEIDCLKDADSQIGLWKETYKYYHNLVGDQEANDKLKSVISASLAKLENPSVAVSTPPATSPSTQENTVQNKTN